MITIDDILNEVKSYNPHTHFENIKKACDFSAKAHEGQTRKSGEPYLIHPLEVSKILTQLKMDDASIIAAILHDTIEDTSVTKNEIEKNFGHEVAEIVDGVTKLSKIKFTTQEDRQAENYRKMILAMSKDIRVIMVKLADRLNNMRTLQYMSEASQVRIAQETLDVFAPIAGRMGIYWIKEELEDLSIKFLKPEVYKSIASRTKRLLKMREEYMQRVINTLSEQIQPSIKDCDITGRVKRAYSIHRKMQVQQISLDDVHDILAFRVLVSNIEQCYEVLGSVHSLWKPVQGRFKDYIAMPKGNNYQSLHTTVVCFDGERVEFQIRTYQMHEIAEKGVAAHWKYKDDGQLDTRDEAKYRWLRQLVDWQSELKDSIEFVDNFKMNLFEDEIFVFTPNGDLKSLCFDATPVDFAYAVHSDIGNRCNGARVNGRIVPLSYKLESGDTIEVLTTKDHVPSKDWLDFVVTTKAKTHIRQYIRKEQRVKSLVIGRNLFESTCQRKKISSQKVLKDELFKNYLKEKKFSDEEDFFVALTYGKIQCKDVLEQLYEKKDDEGKKVQDDDNVIKKIFNKIATRNKNQILVDQQDGIMVTFGKCCSPVLGDPIIGFVTRGRGVAVHRTECDKVLNTDPERRVHVSWNQGTESENIARILVVTEDRKGILAEITRVISEKNVNIVKLMVKTQLDGIARISIEVGVKSISELRRVITAIENLKYVLNVIRE